MCARVFPGIISARKVVWVNVLAYLDPVPAAEGGANMCLSDVARKCANARPGALLEGRYACGTGPNGFAGANECAAEHATAAEGDVCTGASTAAACEANASPGIPLEGRYASRTAPNDFAMVKAGMVAWASVFAAAETTSGLACLPDLSPPAYGSIYLQEHLPLTGPMCSVFVFPLTGLLHFGAFPIPMCSAISAQVF